MQWEGNEENEERKKSIEGHHADNIDYTAVYANLVRDVERRLGDQKGQRRLNNPFCNKPKLAETIEENEAS